MSPQFNRASFQLNRAPPNGSDGNEDDMCLYDSTTCDADAIMCALQTRRYNVDIFSTTPDHFVERSTYLTGFRAFFLCVKQHPFGFGGIIKQQLRIVINCASRYAFVSSYELCMCVVTVMVIILSARLIYSMSWRVRVVHCWARLSGVIRPL